MLGNAARVRVRHDIDLSPYTVLKEGEEGTVVRTYDDAKGVWGVDVKMDNYHKGLAQWDNEAHLVDPELGGLEPAVKIYRFDTLAATIAAMFRPNKFMGATGIDEIVKWAHSPRGKYEPPEEAGEPCDSGWCER